MVAPAFGEYNEDVKPVIQPGSSDSAALDAVCRGPGRAGRQLPLVKTMLIPPAWSHRMAMKPAHRDLFSYCNCVMEPWDGPAAIVATDSRWVVAGHGPQRPAPMRYSRTRDGLLVVGSETGMVPLVDNDVVEKGRVGPGENIAVDLVTGRFYRDQELKDHLAALKPYSRWMENITHLDERTKARPFSPAAYERAELRRRQALYGLTIEDMELILAPMVLDAKEAVGSMGDDTPSPCSPGTIAACTTSSASNSARSPTRRSTRCAMAGDEPEDPLRQSRQRLRRGPEPDPDPAAREPGPDLDRGRGGGGPFRHEPAHHRLHLRRRPRGPPAHALERIRQEAEEAVRGGCEALILSDEAVGPDRVPIPMILAVGAVHSHLVRQGLRSFSYLIARSGECLDTHYFAV